mmetsp:Transcript_7450/g.20304  ORF Transcript_7450/g.20304 Transcript_7450/m.20304 type:complete len:387 (-) Transcript_7450:200-1360(-)
MRVRFLLCTRSALLALKRLARLGEHGGEVSLGLSHCTSLGSLLRGRREGILLVVLLRLCRGSCRRLLRSRAVPECRAAQHGELLLAHLAPGQALGEGLDSLALAPDRLHLRLQLGEVRLGRFPLREHFSDRAPRLSRAIQESARPRSVVERLGATTLACPRRPRILRILDGRRELRQALHCVGERCVVVGALCTKSCGSGGRRRWRRARGSSRASERRRRHARVLLQHACALHAIAGQRGEHVGRHHGHVGVQVVAVAKGVWRRRRAVHGSRHGRGQMPGSTGPGIRRVMEVRGGQVRWRAAAEPRRRGRVPVHRGRGRAPRVAHGRRSLRRKERRSHAATPAMLLRRGSGAGPMPRRGRVEAGIEGAQHLAEAHDGGLEALQLRV